MDSHVLNMYHQARYRAIGHKVMRTLSESLSSEGSCNQNSPEYSQEHTSSQYEEDDNEGQYWNPKDKNLWSQNQKINITNSSRHSSIDEDENIDVQEISIEEKTIDSPERIQLEHDTMEENSLIEGADYDVIQVFAVDPDLDLEGSTDEDEQNESCEDVDDKCEDDGEYLRIEEKPNYSETDNFYKYQNHRRDSACHESLGLYLDAPVVSNVDEYFVKDNNQCKDILFVKDEPVVRDVDEYFIKEPPKHLDNLIAETKLPEESDFRIPKVIPNVDDFFTVKSEDKPKEEVSSQEIITEVPITESDLEVLPNIEDLKRYLLGDMPYTKLKNVQRSCSVPHSPMHSVGLDIDAKTCLSFEDLNLDLSDLSFENEKDKSNTSGKSDDIPRALTEEDVNSFLIKPNTAVGTCKDQDDLSLQDMDIDIPVDTIKNVKSSPVKLKTPIINNVKKIKSHVNSTVLDFCIEKPIIKKIPDLRTDHDDFVDVESCNEIAIPVLEANNLNSLLEQFEATEKLNKKPKKSVISINEPKSKNFSTLTNGMRLQDAGVQLNKTKMRQILMPSTINSTIRRSPSPVHSDHDYCSTKKRHSLPNIKGGQSLLKPEVLSSNNRILNSRHRSCKNKKIVYHLSSDDEGEKSKDTKKNKLIINRVSDDDSDKRKTVVKQTLKATPNSNHRKKVSSTHSVIDSFDKSNGSVMVKNACKASDNASSQDCNSSIKLTIKNKSEVILKNCDSKENQIKMIDKHTSDSIGGKSLTSNLDSSCNHIKKQGKLVDETPNEHLAKISKDVARPKIKVENNRCDDDYLELMNKKSKESDKDCNDFKYTNISHEPIKDVKDEISKPEDFYTALFTDKKDVQVPQNIAIKSEKRSREDEKVPLEAVNAVEIEQPQKKKKLNLQEYKLRRGASSNNSSAQVSPEAIFPEMSNMNIDKFNKSITNVIPATEESIKKTEDYKVPKKVFDPIREASRKILMNTKKQKAEAIRKRDEDIVMSKIPKVDNLELQPLMSDAEMLKIVGMTAETVVPVPIVKEVVQQSSNDYDEIILVSVGTNTDENVFKQTEVISEKVKRSSPPKEMKSTVNFKIKKTDNVLKHNVFDTVKDNQISKEDKKALDVKIDEERYKDITATLKSVGKHVETKILSNSLFASIQDVVMKKAPNTSQSTSAETWSKPPSPVRKKEYKFTKTIIIRDFDHKADHGEDKVILHLEKNRQKPISKGVTIQTDYDVNICTNLESVKDKVSPRKRNDSDMSLSSEGRSPVRKEAKTVQPTVLKKTEAKADRPRSTEKRSRSKERHETKYKRSRSHSRSRRRRTRSRSRGRCRRYRRSDSPYRNKINSRTRSPYRSNRGTTSVRRDYHSNRRSRSRYPDVKCKSPVLKKKSPRRSDDRKYNRTKSLTPPPRKSTTSESSEISSSSSSMGSTSSSASSDKSRRSNTYRRPDSLKDYRKSYSSEDRESNTPVEERRIVFVGRLEKDITKAQLRNQFTKFGPVTEVRLHSKEDGSRYGFVTFQRPRDAWSAVEAGSTFPQYDVGFGGRRAFCRQSYADLDGLEAKYTESAFRGQSALPSRRNDDMSFEQMLLDIKNKLNKRKGDKKPEDSA